jgi:hypothetical protein
MLSNSNAIILAQSSTFFHLFHPFPGRSRVPVNPDHIPLNSVPPHWSSLFRTMSNDGIQGTASLLLDAIYRLRSQDSNVVNEAMRVIQDLITGDGFCHLFLSLLTNSHDRYIRSASAHLLYRSLNDFFSAGRSNESFCAEFFEPLLHIYALSDDSELMSSLLRVIRLVVRFFRDFQSMVNAYTFLRSQPTLALHAFTFGRSLFAIHRLELPSPFFDDLIVDLTNVCGSPPSDAGQVRYFVKAIKTLRELEDSRLDVDCVACYRTFHLFCQTTQRSSFPQKLLIAIWREWLFLARCAVRPVPMMQELTARLSREVSDESLSLDQRQGPLLALSLTWRRIPVLCDPLTAQSFVMFFLVFESKLFLADLAASGPPYHFPASFLLVVVAQTFPAQFVLRVWHDLVRWQLQKLEPESAYFIACVYTQLLVAELPTVICLDLNVFLEFFSVVRVWIQTQPNSIVFVAVCDLIQEICESDTPNAFVQPFISFLMWGVRHPTEKYAKAAFVKMYSVLQILDWTSPLGEECRSALWEGRDYFCTLEPHTFFSCINTLLYYSYYDAMAIELWPVLRTMVLALEPTLFEALTAIVRIAGRQDLDFQVLIEVVDPVFTALRLSQPEDSKFLAVGITFFLSNCLLLFDHQTIQYLQDTFGLLLERILPVFEESWTLPLDQHDVVDATASLLKHMPDKHLPVLIEWCDRRLGECHPEESFVVASVFLASAKTRISDNIVQNAFLLLITALTGDFDSTKNFMEWIVYSALMPLVKAYPSFAEFVANAILRTQQSNCALQSITIEFHAFLARFESSKRTNLLERCIATARTEGPWASDAIDALCRIAKVELVPDEMLLQVITPFTVANAPARVLGSIACILFLLIRRQSVHGITFAFSNLWLLVQWRQTCGLDEGDMIDCLLLEMASTTPEIDAEATREVMRRFRITVANRSLKDGMNALRKVVVAGRAEAIAQEVFTLLVKLFALPPWMRRNIFKLPRELEESLEDIMLTLSERFEVTECWPELCDEAAREPRKPERIACALASARARK